MSSKLSLTKLHKDILKLAKQMLEPYNGTCFIEPHTKHHRLVIQINNKSKFTTLAKTPNLKDFALIHEKNDINKLIKELTNA